MKYKYIVDVTNEFKKDYKKVLKQGKDLDKMKAIIDKLARGESIDRKYRDHKLVDSKKYKNCRELHIEPDWLLVYRIIEDELILVLLDSGSHSDLF